MHALRRGPVHTAIHETGELLVQELDWVRTSETHRDFIPSVEFEAGLLADLTDAAAQGLATLKLTPVAGDSAAYHVEWITVAT